jgi:hypothetical protein
MDVIEKFLHNIAYKFPKGYMDINDIQDVILLENELNKLGINLTELNTPDHWEKRIEERSNILDIENFPNDYPISKEDTIQLIQKELSDRVSRLENLKNFPLSLTHQIGYKLFQPAINHNGKILPLKLKVKYMSKGVEKISVGTSYLVIVENNTLVTFILLANDDSFTIESSMKDHQERNQKKLKPIKILNPTDYQFIIPTTTPTTLDKHILSPEELPYTLRTDYRVGANLKHDQYGTGKIVGTSAGSGGKGDSRGSLDWVDVDFGKTYVSGGIAKTVRRIPNVYTLLSPSLQPE